MVVVGWERLSDNICPEDWDINSKITQSKLTKSKHQNTRKSAIEKGKSPIDKALPSWLIISFFGLKIPVSVVRFHFSAFMLDKGFSGFAETLFLFVRDVFHRLY
jgi:hypothetical protein